MNFKVHSWLCIACVITIALICIHSSTANGQQSPAPNHRHLLRKCAPPSTNWGHRHHAPLVVRDQAVDILWLMSDRYWHVGDYENVIRMHRASVTLDPHFVEAYSVAGWILDSMDRTEEAIALLKEGWKHNQHTYQLAFDLSYIYSRHKNYKEAVKWLERAVQRPGPFWVRHALAHAYEKLGRWKDALKVWEQRLKEEPNNPVVRRNYERVRKKLEKQRSGGDRPQDANRKNSQRLGGTARTEDKRG